MIVQINYIHEFGIFKNFRWSEHLASFSKVNLIYGWNYSGKTTLSRIFQAVEGKTLPSEYSSGRFELVFEDGSRFHSGDTSTNYHVRVFNRDYIQQNFQEEHTAPAVFILGEENKTLQNRLRNLRKRRDRITKLLEQARRKKEDIKAQLDKRHTNKAKDIANLLGVRNFRRPNLVARLDEIRDTPSTYILPDNEVSACLQTIRSVEQHTPINPIKIDPPNLKAIVKQVNTILTQTASNKAIARLKADPELEDWVRQGFQFHLDKSICEFCGNPLTETRLNELKAHFSEEYENLIREIRNKIEALQSTLPGSIDIDEMRIIASKRSAFVDIKKRFHDWLCWANTIINELIELLNKKLTSIETQLNWYGDLDRANDVDKILDELAHVIEHHNRAIKDINITRKKTREKLEKHFAAQHLKEGDILQLEQDLGFQNKIIGRAERLMSKINKKIRKLEAKVNNSSIGAGRLNRIMRYLLADSSIEVEPVNDTIFQFKRSGQLATHLSEGEKTAITLAYFVTNLEAGDIPIENTIIFVDDPISSLDSNHIYAVFALICERLAKAHQLFVSTHNWELFSLLKSQWLGPKGNNTKHSRGYHMWRFCDSSGQTNADLRDLPKLLRRYKSEYEFIFEQLYNFAKTGDPTLHEAYTAPNLLRKFLEAYLGFRKAVPRAWHEKLDVLFDDAESKREVQKFANEGSHLQTLTRIFTHSDIISNAQRCVLMVLNGLEKKDPEHYHSLVEIVEGQQ